MPGKPQEPKIADYEKRREPAVRETRASTAATRSATPGLLPDEVDHGGVPINKRELTSRGLMLFESEQRDYREQLKEYKEIKVGITHVDSWVFNHLAPEEKVQFFGNKETLRQGLKKMETAATPYLKRREVDARIDITNHYRLVPKMLKKMED